MCNRQLGELAKSAEEFREYDVKIIVVVAQEAFRLEQWKAKGQFPFTMVADPMAWVCAQYGVAKQLVVHDEWVNIPAAFVIDKQGVLRYAHVGTAFDDRATAYELLAVVKRLGD